MIKKIAKDVWELLVMGAAAYWIGIMLALGVITACNYAGVTVAIGYSEEAAE